MKKAILSIIAVLSGITSANAQFYIGGSFSLNVSSQSVKELNEPTNPSYSFSLSPEIGYSLNKKMDIGLSFLIGTSSSKNSGIGIDPMNNWVGITYGSDSKSFQISPYFRYSFIQWKKFNLLGSINVYASTDKIKEKYSSQNETKYTSWGINIYPVLTYNLSEKWMLLSTFNFFSLGFSRVKIEMDNPQTTTFNNSFDLGFSSYDLLPSIGIVYKF